MVADTDQWEQSAAYRIDRHPAVFSFVKNAGLGFAIPYLHNNQRHDFIPDFLIKLKSEHHGFLILETKGYDPLKEIKHEAALRWISAVNADCVYGFWQFALAEKVMDVNHLIDDALRALPYTP